jgi:tryptophan-rich hypothetical protein
MPSPANPFNPRKLLHSKWTAVIPAGKERHFLVTRIVESDPPGTAIVAVELEAVLTNRVQVIDWHELTDVGRWQQGWSR